MNEEEVKESSSSSSSSMSSRSSSSGSSSSKPFKNGDKKERDDKGRYIEGYEGGPGRPVGSLSIKNYIKKHLEENPGEFEKLCKYYMKDIKMRDLLWKMIDGLPKQSVEHSGEVKIPVTSIIINPIANDKKTKNNTGSED